MTRCLHGTSDFSQVMVHCSLRRHEILLKCSSFIISNTTERLFSMMSQCLITVTAPCVVEIDSDGELVTVGNDLLPLNTSLSSHSESAASANMTECTHQVPVREYLEQTLHNLVQRNLLVTSASLVGDTSMNTLQVTAAHLRC